MVRTVLVAAVAAVCLIAAPAAGTAPARVLVFLLAGQSNMIGEATPDSDDTARTNVDLLVYTSSGWQPAADPLRALDGEPNGVGPGVAFGRALLPRLPIGTRVGLILCAEGGTSIEQWQPNHPQYEACRDAAAASGGAVAGFFFLQGEHEAHRATGAVEWAAGFPNLERQVEADFGPIPFVLGELGSISAATYPFQANVRNAQAAAAQGHPEITLVATDDLVVSAVDGVHFTAASDRTLGSRLADAWWARRRPQRHRAVAS